MLDYLKTDPVHTKLPPRDAAITSEDDARRIAHQWAMAKRERWQDPIQTDYIYDENGRPCWVVQSNCPGLGYSLIITIDDASGQVIATSSLPR